MIAISEKQENLHPLYSLVPDEIREELESIEEKKTVPAGARLIGQGIEVKQVILIEAGSVEVSLRAQNRVFGFNVEAAGKTFGFAEVMCDTLPAMDVTCKEECSIRCLPGERIKEILQVRLQAYLTLAKILCTELRLAEDLLSQIRCGGSFGDGPT